MPAFNSGDIEKLLISALVSEGMTKKTYDSTGKLVDSGLPSPDALRLGRAIIKAISAYQASWQGKQVVMVAGVKAGGDTVIGSLP